MREKKTRGKQRINIKRIEKDEDRLVTFSKRRSGIHTKISELSILCGADVGFLVYSGSGKPYTFGSPSFNTVAERFLNGDHSDGSSSSSSSSVVDAHNKLKIEELCKTFNDLVEKVDAEEEKAMTVAETELPVESEAWWNVDPKDDQETMQLLAKFEGLYEKLCEVAVGSSHGGNGASTSSFSQVNDNSRGCDFE